MSNELEDFKVGDSIVVVGTEYDGELGTILGVGDAPEGRRYLVVFENGNKRVFTAENLSYRR